MKGPRIQSVVMGLLGLAVTFDAGLICHWSIGLWLGGAGVGAAAVMWTVDLLDAEEGRR